MRFYSHLGREYHVGIMNDDYITTDFGNNYRIIGIQVQSYEIMDAIRFELDTVSDSDGSGGSIPKPWYIALGTGLSLTSLALLIYLRVKKIISCRCLMAWFGAGFRLIAKENKEQRLIQSDGINSSSWTYVNDEAILLQ